MNSGDLSRRPSALLGEFAAQLRYDDLPESVVAHAKAHLIDTVGVCLGSISTDHVRIVADLARASERDDGETVIGHPFRAATDDAVFANGVMGHGIDFDDGHKFVHPGCVIVPVALGLGQHRRATGREVIEALVAGYDVSVRVSLAAGPAHRDRGFHPTGTCNVFGAAVTAARLRGLPASRIHDALGFAASQACSVTQYRANGAPIKHLHAGLAARGGLLSARLAAAGFPGPVEPIEGEFGFLACYAGTVDIGPLVADLGRRYMVAETDIKPYPSCRQTHAPLDLALEAVRHHGVQPKRIVEATLWTYRYAAEKRWMTTSDPPVSPLAGMLSIPFCLASALTDNRLTLGSFDEGALADTGKHALARKIVVLHDQALTARWPDERAARLEIRLDDGRKVTLSAPNPRGGTAAPLEHSEIVEKFLSMAEPVIGGRARTFVDRVQNLESIEDVSDFVRLLGTDGASSIGSGQAGTRHSPYQQEEGLT